MATSKKFPAARYGIAQWYGQDIVKLSAKKRREFGAIACRQAARDPEVKSPPCPFLSTLAAGAKCNKSGGLCSLRKYASLPDGKGQIVSIDKPATMCPLRFLEDAIVFRWVAEKMLGVTNPLVVKETPFLRKIAGVAEITAGEDDNDTDEQEEKKKAGRIDWLLVDPESLDTANLRWCALETQAVYFSGAKMEPEFSAYANDGSKLLYPVGHRRPDYRSNGPKRLAPQLQVKVPVLRAWGVKVAVVVDRFFYEQMARLLPAFATARNDQAALSRAEVVWFIVDYDSNMKLVPGEVVYSDLLKSVEALNAAEPIELERFQSTLQGLLRDPLRRGSKVFSISSEI